MGIRKLSLMLVCALGITSGAQTVNLTAANTKTLAGKTFTGLLCLVPANNSGTVINFQYGNGGQGVTKQVCWPVQAGALQQGVTVPDTAVTNPQNLCLYGTLIDPTQPPSKQNMGTFPCLQPGTPQGQNDRTWCSASNGQVYCNLDNYAPVLGSLVVQQTGIQGPAGTVTVGSVSASSDGTASVTNSGTANAAVLNFTFPAGGTPGSVNVNGLAGADLAAKLSACLGSINSTYGGICEARTMGASTQTWATNVTVSMANTVINLPCATINMAGQLIIAPGTRNVTIHGCAFRGGSTANGTQGGTVLSYTGAGAAIQVGDATYAQDTPGFHMDNVKLVTASAGTSATALAFYRTQDVDLRNVYLNGNQATGQGGIYLDGTGNYAGGTFDSDAVIGFGAGLYMTGHLAGSATGDYANASTFTRLHVVCPTSGGSPVSGTYGINVAAGDGNTWVGGDVEGCDTMFHLGANAINNTVTGLRNENSNTQYLADSGSSFNAVFTGGTFYTGQITDNGSRNSFWDAFHRTVNGVQGDWYASQQDATVVNHLRLGTGTGNVRGLQWESQVDQGTSNTVYNWLWGLTDGAAGASNWVFQDLINNAMRLQIVENNAAGGNNQSALNAAGTGNVCFNCSNNSGTGGVAFGSGGATPSTVGTWDAAGNVTQFGYHRFMVGSTEAWRWDCASTSVCYLKSMSPTANAPHFTIYNGSATDIESEGTAAVTFQNKSTSGTGGVIFYEGGANYNTVGFRMDSSGNLYAPALKSTTGTRYLCIDSSGEIHSSTTACSGT